jgi:hypothetical protein
MSVLPLLEKYEFYLLRLYPDGEKAVEKGERLVVDDFIVLVSDIFLDCYEKMEMDIE